MYHLRDFRPFTGQNKQFDKISIIMGNYDVHYSLFSENMICTVFDNVKQPLGAELVFSPGDKNLCSGRPLQERINKTKLNCSHMYHVC